MSKNEQTYWRPIAAVLLLFPVRPPRWAMLPCLRCVTVTVQTSGLCCPHLQLEGDAEGREQGTCKEREKQSGR